MYLCNLHNKNNSILVPGSVNAGKKKYPCRVNGIISTILSFPYQTALIYLSDIYA